MGKNSAKAQNLLSFIQYSSMFDVFDSDAFQNAFHGPIPRLVVDRETQKIRPFMTVMDPTTEWIHVNPDMERMCNLLTIIFQFLKFVPTFCMNCWKVVVSPTSLKELLMLEDLMIAMADEDSTCWCKCGTEIRPEVFGNYGGYFYNNSFKDGQDKYVRVRKAVNDRIGPHVRVILKRYCSEMERMLGHTKGYQQPKKAKIWESKVFESFDLQAFNNKDLHQPESIKRHIRNHWIRFAWDRGDSSVLELNNGEPLFRILDTYHEDLERKIENET